VALVWRLRAAAAVAAALVAVGHAAGGAARADAGHGLSVVLPAGARLALLGTGCTDPIERFSVVAGGDVLTLEERVYDARDERSPPRHGRFAVRGAPSGIACCSSRDRAGWVIPFRDHRRAFYAYLYPGGRSPARLLRVLDSLRVARA
jgi:hypothetical protein